MSQDSGYLSARDAAAALGVRPQTLYAYVSRGLVRSEATGRRDRRYHAEDIAALRRRREGNPSAATEAALSFGAPVLESAITLILDGKLYYRGQDATRLARHASIHEVAALLWQADAAAIFGDDNLPLVVGGLPRRAASSLDCGRSNGASPLCPSPLPPIPAALTRPRRGWRALAPASSGC